MLLFITCSNNKSSMKNIKHLHFTFKKLGKNETESCLGKTISDKLYTSHNQELQEVFIIEVQNVSIDSIAVSYNSIAEGIPVYFPNKIKYFHSINDTVPIDVSLPFNIPDSKYILGKNEKKCFLISFKLDSNIAKIDYPYYIISKEKRTNNIELILTYKNNEIIDMTKY